MTKPQLQITRDERTVEFTITTTDQVASFRGTTFTPNQASATIHSGKILSINLAKLDEHGYGIDDPAGPDGAELNVSFGGGEITAASRIKLPELARDVLTAIEKATQATA
jgi:hypothetical protein